MAAVPWFKSDLFPASLILPRAYDPAQMLATLPCGVSFLFNQLDFNNGCELRNNFIVTFLFNQGLDLT